MIQTRSLQVGTPLDTAAAYPYLMTDMFSETATEAKPMDQLDREVAERVTLYAATEKSGTCRRLPSDESAYPFKFQSNIIAKTPEFFLFYHSFKNSAKVLFHYKGQIDRHKLPVLHAFHAEGPPDDAWTVSDWVIDAEKTCTIPPRDEDIDSIREELNGLLDNFKTGLLLDRPDSFLSMADQVAISYDKKMDEDVEVWAEKLTKDLSKLSD